MSRRRAGALAVALCLAGGPARAGGPVELAWHGPASCGPESFERALAGYLGQRGDPAAALPVRVRVGEQGGLWSLELAAVGGVFGLALGLVGRGWRVELGAGGRTALTLQIDLVVPLVRRDFSVRGLPVLHRIGPIAGRGLVGVEFRPAGRKS